jgi:hypothetical protein
LNIKLIPTEEVTVMPMLPPSNTPLSFIEFKYDNSFDASNQLIKNDILDDDIFI